MTTSYTPPPVAAIAVTLAAGYTPPGGSAVNVVLGDATPPPVVSLNRYVAVVSPFASAMPRGVRALNSPWVGSGRRDQRMVVVSGVAVALNHLVLTRWVLLASVDVAKRIAWQIGRPSARALSGRWTRVGQADNATQPLWSKAPAWGDVVISVPWVKVYPYDAQNQAPWNKAALPPLIYRKPATGKYTPPPGGGIETIIKAGYVLPAVNAINVVLSQEEQVAPVLVRNADPSPWVIRWGAVATADTRYTLPWGPSAKYRVPDPPPTDSGWTGSPNEPPPIPIARRVYIVMNDVSVVRLPERTPIDVLSVDLNSTVDAWCWALRMELADPTQVALLKPDGNGPKLVEITMNSYVWTAIIEGRDRSRELANAAVTVIGRSQTALMSDDYTARRSLAVADPYSAQQLANLEISQRALPFTIDWRGLDWVVPGGVWYYQDMSPINVISQIAASRGAVLQSHPSDPQLIVQSRYPVSPWNWSAGNADVALPSDWITGYTAQQQTKPFYDAVIIAGQQQGVLAKVTRSGSAGQTFASQVVDQLNVTADVATERGRNVLSDRGMQELVDVDIPLFAPGTVTAGMSGLYTPLLLVDVQDPSDPWQGQSVGVSISARRAGNDNKALEIWQRVSLERHMTDAN